MSHPQNRMHAFGSICRQVSLIAAAVLAGRPSTAPRTAHRRAFAEPLEPRLFLAANPAVGVNFDPLSYWDTAWTFKDAFKSSSSWFVYAYNTVTHGETRDGAGSLDLDAHGWPTQLKTWTNDQGQLIKQHAESVMFYDIGDKFPGGTYRAEWQGTGKVRFSYCAKTISTGVAGDTHYAILNVTPGSSNGILAEIEETDPADPIRDIHIWMPDYDGQSFVGQAWQPGANFSPFHPLFLQRLQPFSTLRFMQWANTTISTLVHWQDRTHFDDARQAGSAAGKGVAYEYMIELANELHDNIWINLPHQADDDFLRNYATLVRDTFDPNQKIYLEWSNEIWNSGPGFNTESWITQQMAKPENAGLDRWIFVASRIKNAFDIWSDVFAGQENRLVRVIAGQAVNPSIANQQAKNMDGHFDAIASGGYLHLRSAVQSTWNANTTVDQIISELVSDVPQTIKDMQGHKQLADKYSTQLGRKIQYVVYEGGQALRASNAPYQQAFYDAQSDPRMYDIYAQLLRGFRDIGGDLFMHYTYACKDSAYGSWGLLKYQDQPIADAPKYQALLDAASGMIYYDPPIADAAGPYTVAEGASVQLNADASTGHNLSYTWDLDNDGIFGETGPDAAHGDETGPNPTFLTNGLNGPQAYPATLRVADSFGRTDTKSVPIDITDVAPVLAISGGNSRVAGLPYILTLAASDPGPDPVLSWIFDWGDGTTPQAINGDPSFATYIYTAPGSFTITAQAVNQDGSFSTTKSAPVVVAANAGGPYSVTEGSSAQVNAIISRTSGYTYTWDLDNDGIFGETGPNAAHGNETGPNPAFLTNGLNGPQAYTVTLHVTDALGQVSTAPATINIADVPPVVIIIGQNSTIAGLPCTLNLSTADPGPDPILSWIIDWGDGSAPQAVTGNPSSIAYTYTAPGSFAITAQAVNQDGSFNATRSASVVVAANAAGPYFVTEGASVQLNAIASRSSSPSYQWDLDGDGIYGEAGSDAAHGDEIGPDPIFLTNGLNGPQDYIVALRVIDALGQVSTASAAITITDIPPTLGIAGQNSATAGLPYTLLLSASDPGPDSIDSWLVFWGDGTYPDTVAGSVTSITHTYTVPGVYNISARADTQDGPYYATIAEPVTVNNDPPSAVFARQNVIAMGEASTDLTITYSDATGFPDNAFDNTDIIVTGPRRFRQYAAFVSKTTIGSTTEVTYRLAAPGGFWGPEDNGKYNVWLMADAVADALGAAVPQARLATFPANLQSAGNTIQSAASFDVASPGEILAAQQSLPATQTDAYYKLRVISPVSLDIELSGLTADSNITIVNRFGRPLGPTSSNIKKPKAAQLASAPRRASSTKGPVTRTANYPLAPGLYYIRIHTPGGRPATYGLRVKLSRAPKATTPVFR